MRTLIADDASVGTAMVLAQTKPAPDLAVATIADLMTIQVTTASRAPEGILRQQERPAEP